MEVVFAVSAFWGETSSKYKEESPISADRRGRGALSQTRLALTYQATWTCAIFLFLYGGVEVAIGGWIVVFMTNVRHGSAFASGMTETGFWLGITVGRFVLGFVSPRLGEKLAIAMYLSFSIALELIFLARAGFHCLCAGCLVCGLLYGHDFPLCCGSGNTSIAETNPCCCYWIYGGVVDGRSFCFPVYDWCYCAVQGGSRFCSRFCWRCWLWCQ